MGYHSSYDFCAYDITSNKPICNSLNNEEFTKIAESIKYFPKSENRNDNDGVFDDIYDDTAHWYGKWYGMEECLKEASYEWPTVALVLSVEGEDQGDISLIVAHNGEVKAWQAPPVEVPSWETLL